MNIKPTWHTDREAGDVVIVHETVRGVDCWSVNEITRVLRRQVVGWGRYYKPDAVNFFRLAMTMEQAATALRHLEDRQKDALRTLKRQHNDRVMRLIEGNQ